MLLGLRTFDMVLACLNGEACTALGTVPCVMVVLKQHHFFLGDWCSCLLCLLSSVLLAGLLGQQDTMDVWQHTT